MFRYEFIIRQKKFGETLEMGLSNMPWEDRPAGSADVVWRYSRNPIVPQTSLPEIERPAPLPECEGATA